MGTIETCRMIYLRQSLKLASYECARIGITAGYDSVETMRDLADVNCVAARYKTTSSLASRRYLVAEVWRSSETTVQASATRMRLWELGSTSKSCFRIRYDHAEK